MPVPRKIIGTCCHQGKDTFYRYLNTPTTSWRKLLYRITLSFIRVCASQKSDQSTSGPRCLIFDDTLLPKTGKKRKVSPRCTTMLLGKCVWGTNFSAWSISMELLPSCRTSPCTMNRAKEGWRIEPTGKEGTI